jgi:hypothetical protein
MRTYIKMKLLFGELELSVTLLLCSLKKANVRVRWVDHKCKVNSDEFDEEATLCSW